MDDLAAEVGGDGGLAGRPSIAAADHDAARAALVGTWLRTFGPATVNDVKWWFGHTLTWARDGVA